MSSRSADVVIVGSGASGAVAAAQFASAGQSVLIVEEGPWVTPKEMRGMRPSQSLEKIWRGAAMTAAIGVGDSPIINLTMGRCVGGSSVLTGGVCFRTPGHVLKVWREERGLTEFTEEHLEPYYREIERICNIEEVPISMRSKSTTLWGIGAEQMGATLVPNKRNTKGCDGCSQCNFGCPKGAKQSVDLNFLPRALEAGAEVLSDCEVTRVLTKGSRAVGVEGRVRNSGGKRRKVTIHARRVVVAAGGGHTPVLLLKSGIGRRSKQVGRNLTLHPGFRMMARFDEVVDGWKGAMQSAHSTAWEEERITMMSLYVPPAIVVSALAGFGPEFMERAEKLRHLAMFGGMIHDEGGGRIRRGIGREPIMTYRMAREDRDAVPRIIRRLGEAYLNAGARELYLPILGYPPVSPDEFRTMDLAKIPAGRLECTSQHPLGSCRMGDSPTNSAIDADGKAWDLDELYVIDGSTVPTSLGVNPQQTIMTLALRQARRMLDRPLPEV